MSPEQIEVERKAFEAEAIAGLNSAEYAVAWVFWLARAEKAQRVREALVSAAAHFAAATSAYESFVGRAGRRGKPDPFFSTRLLDFAKATEAARAALKD